MSFIYVQNVKEDMLGKIYIFRKIFKRKLKEIKVKENEEIDKKIEKKKIK